MASSVATPLEKQFSTIAGLDALTSTSGQGTHLHHPAVQPRSRYRCGRGGRAGGDRADAPAAAAEHGAAFLLQGGPIVLADSLLRAHHLDSLPLSALDEYGQTLIAQRLSTVEGVAQVQVYGSQKYAVRVQLDPQALAARRIGLE